MSQGELQLQIDIVQRLPAKPPVLILGAYAGRQLTPFAARMDRKLGGMLARAMRAGASPGGATSISISSPRLTPQGRGA